MVATRSEKAWRQNFILVSKDSLSRPLTCRSCDPDASLIDGVKGVDESKDTGRREQTARGRDQGPLPLSLSIKSLAWSISNGAGRLTLSPSKTGALQQMKDVEESARVGG